MLQILLIGLILILGPAVPSMLMIQYLVVPPHNWKDKIKRVLDHGKPIYLKVGTKLSAYRRRLVLATVRPSFYTNYAIEGRKLVVCPDDIEQGDRLMAEFTRRDPEDPKRRLLYGFFHPYANNGGGGEKVLWHAVQATLLHSDRNVAVVYTVNKESPAEILTKTEEKFGLAIDADRVVFIYLRRFGRLIDASYWKHFTIVGQLFGSAVLAMEAVCCLTPDIWVDTIGLPGSYVPIGLLVRIPIATYTHYPIIQQDMFNKLDTSSLAGMAKYSYWSVLYFLYSYMGYLCTVVMTNGSWTFNHLNKIYKCQQISIVYPPCGKEVVEGARGDRDNKMIYIAQFRPEKRHDLIVREYAKFLEDYKGLGKLGACPTIVFLGSCRTKDDTATLDALREQVKDLGLQDSVEFVVDCAYSDVVAWLNRCKYGLNAMWNEHFGIGVVEYLAHGVIPIVHASAGPFLDIVVEIEGKPTGFFFNDESDPDYTGGTSLSELFRRLFLESPLSEEEIEDMRRRGRLAMARFTDEEFRRKWMAYVPCLEEAEMVERGGRSSVQKVY